MTGFILRRIGSTFVVMTIVGVLVFMLLHLAPGDPAAIVAGDNATNAQIDAIRARLGLDDPLLVQFGRWAGGVLQGDLGVSIFTGDPVLDLVRQRIEPTLSLALATITLAVVLAIFAGVVAAANAGGWIDRSVMALSVVSFSVPVFVVGYVLIYLFSIQLKWTPVQGYMPLSEDYIRTARAKGVAEPPVLVRHALKNAGVPIVTIIGIGVALLIGGVVITETVFNIPGMGRLVVDAIAKRDYPIIQGVILIFSGVYVLVNLLVDLAYTLLDPRIRY
jgi:peptide/nickel transport system permease protein